MTKRLGARMKEMGILFSAPLVRALLAGTKTQTRRLMNPQPPANDAGWYPSPLHPRALHYASEKHMRKGLPIDFAPYEIGQRLWVRETFAFGRVFDGTRPGEVPGISGDRGTVWYAADSVAEESWANRGKWRPSIFMPRWASRITLEVTEVRVQRLQDISEEDAKAEGVDPVAMREPGDYPDWMQPVKPGQPHRIAFGQLWDRINGEKAAWSSNPWVWAISFRRLP